MNEGDAAAMQQSYPSPNAIAADNGGPFYSSQNQATANMTSPEELQLAAQLSRNMAPNMSGDNVIDSLPAQDPRAQQGVVNHQYQQDAQNHAMHDHQQQQHIVHHQQANNAQLNDMTGQYGSPIPADAATAANRRRSKVSRACDECRRKKIRCDASEESGEGAQCTNCKRVGTECRFSRVPMKRGPSKGYIKELADRLNTLEGALQAGEIPQSLAQQHENPYQRRPSEEFSPAPGLEQGRKRSFSSISNDFNTSYQAQRTASSWPSQDPARQNHPSATSFPPTQLSSGNGQLFRDHAYSSNGTQQGTWKMAPDASNRQSNALMSQADQAPVDQAVTQALAREYYNTIHATFPILSQSDTEPIAKVTSASHNSFYNALHNAVRSFTSDQASAAPLPVYPASFDHSVRSTKILHLQTMLLELIELTNLDPTYKHRRSSMSSSMLLGSAIGLANSLKLHVYKQSDRVPDGDNTSDDNLERRLWWNLVVMDKWHAASTSSPAMIPDNACQLHPNERAVLGDHLFCLARLSLAIGFASEILTIQDEPGDINRGPSKYGHTVASAVDHMFTRAADESPMFFYPPANVPCLHFCFWSGKILHEIVRVDSDPEDLLESALNMMTQLNYYNGFVGPLTYHASSLGVLALIELLGYDQTKVKATEALESFLEGRHAPSSWDGAISAHITNKLSPTAKIANQTLQHLADTAIATTEEGKPEQGVNVPRHEHVRYHELRAIIRKGYANYLVDLATNK